MQRCIGINQSVGVMTVQRQGRSQAKNGTREMTKEVKGAVTFIGYVLADPVIVSNDP